MSQWDKDLLERIAQGDDFHISVLRDDLETLGTPTWIWSVVVDGGLYVRAYNGRNSRWYRSAMKNKAGRIRTAGAEIDVNFAPVEGTVNDRIDDAYRAKYAASRYLAPMIAAGPRGATVRVSPAG